MLNDRIHKNKNTDSFNRSPGEYKGRYSRRSKAARRKAVRHNSGDRVLKLLYSCSTQLKYSFSGLLVIAASFFSHKPVYLIEGLCELALILYISNVVISRFNKPAVIANQIVMLLFNIQYTVLYFGGTFVSLVMLDNLGALDMLRGKAVQYICGAVLVIFFSGLPHRVLNSQIFRSFPVISALLAIMLIFTTCAGNAYAPFYNLINTGMSKIRETQFARGIDPEGFDEQLFYRDYSAQGREKPSSIPEKPNIIVIFIEGLSNRIIDDERSITPNIRTFRDETLSFNRYYNHTAATYRGLIGTLFSGYQMQNLDKNRLISLQSTLKQEGYYTSFLNVEPKNGIFTRYLEDLGFDSVQTCSGESKDVGIVYDKESFEYLFSYIDKSNSSGKPFLTCIYTIGTHVSFESKDVTFGDGKSNFLNRFYQMDYHFGTFLEKFKNSSLADNTVIVFTTDHCTYVDNDYLAEYDDPDNKAFIDEIPFLIYYPGVIPESIDAGGRNSLDLVPTVCDLLDISRDNYFLGNTLFQGLGEIDNDYDTITCIGDDMTSTMEGEIVTLSDSQAELISQKIRQYYAISKYGVK